MTSHIFNASPLGRLLEHNRNETQNEFAHLSERVE